MMQTNNKFLLIICLGITYFASGCTGLNTFHDHARAGDTVAIAAGRAVHLQRGNFEVTITDAAGTVTTYAPGQSNYDAVKASVNLYPDPLSSLVVSDRTGEEETIGALTYTSAINFTTSDDRNWWETVVFVDLPDPMALGDATIVVKDTNTPAIETVSSVVTIIADETGTGTGGTPNAFSSKTEGAPQFNLIDRHFQSMERVPHYEINFSGTTLPYALQIDLTHDPDQANSGTGTPYVINPIGHIKNVSWSTVGSNGTDLRVIITPTEQASIRNINDFTFYIAGGITGLAVNGSVQAFDNAGQTINGISASIISN